MPKKENPEWLYEKLENLTELSRQLSDDEITTEYHEYTALKLIAIRYYAKVFSDIVNSPRQRTWYDGAVYVDLFAGTGLVKLKGSKHDDFLPGSPLCAGLIENGFAYIVCVEKDKEKYNALQTRLSKILPREKFGVIHGDCNTEITKVIDMIKQRFDKPILLTFVDPEGLDVKFSTIKELGDSFRNCDFLMNVNAQGVRRVSAKYQKGVTNVKKSLENYLDSDVNDILRELAEGKMPQEQVADLIRGSLGKPMGSTIKIRDEGERIAYYLLGYTRETKGGSQYSDVFDTLRRRLEWADRTQVRRQIERIHQRQSGLEDFSSGTQ